MKAVAICVCLAGVPASALAQGAIAGVVRSSSGAAIPGVLIQATSPALIEAGRTAVTDGAGRYRIEDLRPGTYKVRFDLSGWSPREYEGIALIGSATAIVDAQLDIGSTETVTVHGRTPVIDVESAKRQVTLTGETVKTLPTALGYNALLVLIPGVVTNTNDIVTGTATTSFPIHGGRTNEGRLSLDGLTVGSPPGGNSATSYVIDAGNVEQTSFTTGGGLGEAETAGLVMNIVSKSGGNSRHGSLFASGTGGSLQSNNLTPSLKAQGVTAATPMTKVYDVTGTFGGPIGADRLWYFVSGHVGGSTKDSSNVYYNLNTGDPSKWLYTPNLSRREYSDRTFENASGRLTWQMTSRQKLSGVWDAQSLCRTCTGATPGLSEPQRVSPEAVGVLGRPLNVSQVTWSSPRTNRLLLS